MDMNNTTIFNRPDNYSSEYILAQFSSPNISVLVLYVIVFVLALISNVIVIIVVIKDQYMRSVTNYFLVNVSVADLLVTLICMPHTAYTVLAPQYSLPEFACKIISHLQCVSVASSIFTITTMSVDRYLAITKPFGVIYRCFNKKSTITVIILLWIIPVILFLPILQVNTIQSHTIIDTHTMLTCEEDWRGYFVSQSTAGITWFIFMFAIPGVVMLFAYSMMGRTLCAMMPQVDQNEGMSCCQQRNRVMRDRKRVACILLLLAFVFAVCWLPYNLNNLIEDTEMSEEKITTALSDYLLLLGHSNSALNPIIYCVLSRKFRKSIRNLFTIKWEYGRRSQLKNWRDSSGSATQLHYLHRLKSIPTVQNQLNITLSRLQSSQKATTTRTYAV